MRAEKIGVVGTPQPEPFNFAGEWGISRVFIPIFGVYLPTAQYPRYIARPTCRRDKKEMEATQTPLPPAAAPPPRPSKPGKTCGMKMLTAVLVVLILMVVYCLYRMWRARRLGPPANCDDYPDGPLTSMCKAGVDACKGLDGRDGDACRAAVGACMPIAEAAYDYSQEGSAGPGGGKDAASLFNRIAPKVPDCAAAAFKISPAGAAKAFDSLGIPDSLPPGLAPFYKDPETRHNVQALADLVPDAVNWSLDFGKNLPVKESFTPLGSQSQCYDDMGCRAGGYCQYYFPDDPTYGGQCVPS